LEWRGHKCPWFPVCGGARDAFEHPLG